MASLTRRNVLRGAGAVGFAGASLASLRLPFFDVPGAQQDPARCRARDVSDRDARLVVSNWPAYIDPRKQRDSTFQVFQRQTGISVDYTDDVNDNQEFYAKVKNQLATCQSVNRDIMVLTDWMAARMIDLGWIQPLDTGALPNVRENLIDSLRAPAWDPQDRFHVPWQSGLTGIAYNSKVTGEVSSFAELLERPDLKGKVTLLTEMRDTMAFMLKVVDADPEDFTDDQWQTALERLRKAVSDGQVRAFNGNDYLNDLASGNTAACEAWSGDTIVTQLENPDIKWVFPDEGVSLWSDNMIVPNLATHQANAEKWMNYYYDPEVAAKLAAWNYYICPVKGAREVMQDLDPTAAESPLIFPDDELLSTSFGFMALDDRQTTAYERDWSDVQSG
ncbi:spermidine/putrescine ABC transporter substrate-binding protein [Nocardioides rotundus]|uniref:polyamine ABC transporter substrate-binding protein n=1 Tax=Nocardioides rotundus TaxID=1774216 RepID=UPI001CBECB63|nr:spermidine/putrescine ABC transporter substrate-binding protein [Nocardioides rotundus]UAL28817.1 spermidine/putrescine ABC transporter substrate-binding protein [Nocardioides rotundus]